MRDIEAAEVLEHAYNSQRPYLLLREYGRNVQQLAEHLTTLEDKEKRSELAEVLIKLMKQLNPSVKEANSENPQRIWDHLHVMAGFKLDIDSEFDAPTPDTIFQKPDKVAYDQKELKFRNYGRNVELLMDQAMEMDDEEERLSVVKLIARLMRTFHAAWNKETLSNEVICQHLKSMSKGKLDYAEMLKEHPYLFDSVNPHREQSGNNHRHRHHSNHNNNHRNKRRNNRKRKSSN